jgi:hypothetical protein
MIRGPGISRGKHSTEHPLQSPPGYADNVPYITANFLILKPDFSTFASSSLLGMILKMSSNHPAKSSKPERLHLEKPSIANEDGCIEETSFDKEAEKRLLRKLDWHIVPILWLIFMLAFLDRTNVCLAPAGSNVMSSADSILQIGNARIQGMTEDLKMTGNDYNIALLSFFVTYILFEVPSNIVSYAPIDTINLPHLTKTTRIDNQACKAFHLFVEYHGALGHRYHRSRICEEPPKLDRTTTTGRSLRSRPVPWLPVLDLFVVQTI